MGRGFSTEDLIRVINRITWNVYEGFFSPYVSAPTIRKVRVQIDGEPRTGSRTSGRHVDLRRSIVYLVCTPEST